MRCTFLFSWFRLYSLKRAFIFSFLCNGRSRSFLKLESQQIRHEYPFPPLHLCCWSPAPLPLASSSSLSVFAPAGVWAGFGRETWADPLSFRNVFRGAGETVWRFLRVCCMYLCIYLKWDVVVSSRSSSSRYVMNVFWRLVERKPDGPQRDELYNTWDEGRVDAAGKKKKPWVLYFT